jgi:hypothetical protein
MMKKLHARLSAVCPICKCNCSVYDPEKGPLHNYPPDFDPKQGNFILASHTVGLTALGCRGSGKPATDVVSL